MLKIITTRADNGNVFLCLSCYHAKERSGRLSEKQVFCNNAEMAGTPTSREIPFIVTSCTGYESRALSTEGSKTYKTMRQTAWYIDASQEDSGKRVFLPPDKAKDRGLWNDYD